MVKKSMKTLIRETKYFVHLAVIYAFITLGFHLLGVHGLHSPWYHVLIGYGLLVFADRLWHTIFGD